MRKVSLLLLVSCLVSLAFAQETLLLIDWASDRTSVNGIVEIRGTVNPPGLQSYFLEAAPFSLSAPVTGRWTPVTLPALNPVLNGVLGTWDTTVFADNVYQLRLRAVLTSGESVYYTIAPIAVSNEGKAFSSAPVTAIETPGAAILTAIPTNTPIPPTPLPIPPTTAPNVPIVSTSGLPIGGHVDRFDAATIAAMHSAGMSWVKFQIRYRLGDNTDYVRGKIEQGKAAGFKVLLGIVGYLDELKLGNEYYPQFAAYLGQVAALNPDAIEVWNEMNLDREWVIGRISPRNYAEMLRPAYAAIKAANPNVMVITGALAPTGAEGAFGLDRVWNDNRYYQGMAATDIPQNTDCIGVHYNEGIMPPEATSGDPRDNYPTRYLTTQLERVRYAFRTFAGLPMCFTELGYLTPEGYPPLPAGFAWAGNVTVAQQAQWLQGAARILANYQDMPVKLMIVWNVDFTRYDDDPQGGYAIMRPDGTCPACVALAGR